MSKRKQDLLLISAWTLLLYWVSAWNGDLRGDALTYAVIAKGIAQGGSWLHLKVIDIPYQNKPPLFFWVVAVFFKLLGTGFYASKLPALLFATADVFLVYFVALKFFKKEEIAFFSAFSFVSARWLVRSFVSTRPESLLALALLGGLYAIYLMGEKRRAGPYLFGASFVAAYMAKMTFAFVLPVWLLIYAVSARRVGEWLRWGHAYGGLALALSVPVLSVIYFEMTSPGYARNLFLRQTFERAAVGLDVRTDKLMYLKDLLYYQPWLIFLLIGGWVLWAKRKESESRFMLISTVLMALVLQFSVGKASRYLVPVSPMLAMITAHGVSRVRWAGAFLRKLALFAAPVLLLFFWTVPVPLNQPRFHTLRLALELQKERPDSNKHIPLSARAGLKDKIELVQWMPHELAGKADEYRLSNYFYLPEGTPVLDSRALTERATKGQFLFLAPARYMDKIPAHLSPILIDSDGYHVLFLSVPGRS
jgi:4-amino-4-deoxy-L-arabinose transferase-like glycosyltransferase